MEGFGTEMEDVECGFDGCQTDGLENRACFPIFVSPNDTDFGHHKRCLMFVRSQEAPNEDCVPGLAHHSFFSPTFNPFTNCSTSSLCTKRAPPIEYK